MRAETAYIMKLNAQQRFERLNLYGLVQGLSYVAVSYTHLTLPTIYSV